MAKEECWGRTWKKMYTHTGQQEGPGGILTGEQKGPAGRRMGNKTDLEEDLLVNIWFGLIHFTSVSAR